MASPKRKLLLNLILYFLGVNLLFVILLSGNTLAIMSDMISEKNMPVSDVCQIIFMRMPAIFILMSPVAVLVAILIVHIRPNTSMVFLSLTFALVVSILSFTLNDMVVPEANHASQQLIRAYWVWDGTGEFPGVDVIYGANRTPQEMNSKQLLKVINSFRENDSPNPALETDYHFKFSLPFANIIFAMVGLSFCLLYLWKTQNLILRVAIIGSVWIACIGCIVGYWFLMTYFRHSGQAGEISPMMAAWGTNIVFFVLGLPSLFFIKR